MTSCMYEQHLENPHPVTGPDFFCHLAGPVALTGKLIFFFCPLDRVLTYKNFIYLLNLQFNVIGCSLLRLSTPL